MGGFFVRHIVEPSGSQKKKRLFCTLLITLSVIVVLVTMIVFLNANLLLPWQGEARKNQQVILEYAEEHYPKATIINKEFNTAKPFVWNNFRDCIVFKLDDVEFGITAEKGRILVDGYFGARVIAQFDEIIQDGFLNPRGITAYTNYIFADIL